MQSAFESHICAKRLSGSFQQHVIFLGTYTPTVISNDKASRSDLLSMRVGEATCTQKIDFSYFCNLVKN